jgi:hypothetical protein
MKEVMAKLSTDEGEVKRFEYVPVRSPQLQLLFELSRPHSISELKQRLLRLCSDRTLTVEEAHEKTTVDTPYMLRHVKDAIIESQVLELR